jgi:hypothetical protein
MDLKQFVLGLVTNQDSIPLFAKAHIPAMRQIKTRSWSRS